jgi:hypothetical protein
MTYKLFLDDVRDLNWVYPNTDSIDWIICKTYDEAVAVINEVGFPEFVSFDHDLGEDSFGSGFDFAKHLVEVDLDFGVMPINFAYAVHSANLVGAENIRGLLDNYLKTKQKE